MIMVWVYLLDLSLPGKGSGMSPGDPKMQFEDLSGVEEEDESLEEEDKLGSYHF